MHRGFLPILFAGPYAGSFRRVMFVGRFTLKCSPQPSEGSTLRAPPGFRSLHPLSCWFGAANGEPSTMYVQSRPSSCCPTYVLKWQISTPSL